MRVLGLFAFLLLCSCKTEPKSIVGVAPNHQEYNNHYNLEVYDYEHFEKFLKTTSDTTFVINFWATWCAPCVKELPSFEQLNSKFSDEKLKVILVSLDFPKNYDSSLKPFIKEQQIVSKVIALNDSDSNSWIPKISEEWSGAIPATLIYNKDKRQFYGQSFTYQELETEVKQILK